MPTALRKKGRITNIAHEILGARQGSSKRRKRITPSTIDNLDEQQIIQAHDGDTIQTIKAFPPQYKR
jgi:hypothetical protein